YRNHYDVYDPQGYGNTNNQLGGRANIGQASGYALVIEDDGRSNLTINIPDGTSLDNEKVNQAQWYRDYLAQGLTGLAGTATLWVIGESTAFEKAANPLFTTDMGLATIVADQALSTNPDVRGQTSFTFWNGTNKNFLGDNFSLNGGCPTIRNYDGAGVAGGAVATHKYATGTTVGTGAIIMNKNATLKWNTIWSGFGWFDMRDAFGGSPATPQENLVKKVLEATLPLNCVQAVNPTDAPPPDVENLPKFTSLHQNVPNPFNPTTKITFDMAHTGHAKLAVYDVAGHLVKTLIDGTVPAQRNYEVTWNGLDQSGHHVPSGVYFYQLVT